MKNNLLQSTIPKKYSALFSNDVETTSILNNTLSDATGKKVLKEGMPALLDIYQKYNVKSTFFFTGYIAEKFPEIVKMILPYGHEVACHGYSHEVSRGFDVLSFEQQVSDLRNAKRILEDVSGQEVISFRAPALRINGFTAQALYEAGFKIDSSVASQRLDMIFSFGSMQKLHWIAAPRKPYFTDPDKLWKKGCGNIFEIPVSSFGFPYIGTLMRISPVINKILGRALHIESSLNKKPIVFLIHPNELIVEELVQGKVSRRSKNLVGYYLKDKLRRQLKLRNLGPKAGAILEEELKFFLRKDYKFICMKDYYLEFKNDINV